jgi:catechol 2,3-dioxygenase-like lactoylglutathione lyase family enzyme
MNTPGLSHIILTVSDLDRSRAFYRDLLGFQIREVPDEFGGTFFTVVGGVSIWFVTHDRTPPGDRFSEFRIGLDHLAFTAPSEAALQELADRLIAAGVDTKGAETYISGHRYVAFRDPDNIQLEYWLPKPAEK